MEYVSYNYLKINKQTRTFRTYTWIFYLKLLLLKELTTINE